MPGQVVLAIELLAANVALEQTRFRSVWIVRAGGSPVSAGLAAVLRAAASRVRRWHAVARRRRHVPVRARSPPLHEGRNRQGSR